MLDAEAEQNSQEIVTVPSTTEATSTSSAPQGATVTITNTDAGFSPSPVTISVGDTVEFKNASSADFWPASAAHPTHTVYPGSDIKKCGTAEQSGIFDACRGLATSESFTFTFNEVGIWRYHDHLQATVNGTITVTE